MDDIGNPLPLRANRSGGSATASGTNFHAALCAIAMVHIARGTALGWLPDLVEDRAVELEAETGGPGDDMALSLVNGQRIEVQAKRGLRAGTELWDTLLALARGISAGAIDFGLLAVSADSSRSITHLLARDLTRLGDGRRDDLSKLGKEFVCRLEGIGLSIEASCAKLRIKSFAVTPENSASVDAMRAELSCLLANAGATTAAQAVLLADAAQLIAMRGRRTAVSIARSLTAGSIVLREGADAGTAGIVARLARWTLQARASYGIVGMAKQLSIGSAWLEQHARVVHPAEPHRDLASALAAYQKLEGMPEVGAKRTIDAKGIARFIRHAIVIGGPGMGKSTLAQKLAYEYALDGYPVLMVKLKLLVERIRRQGAGFEEAIFALGLDRSGIGTEAARRAGITNWVLLCDGLDECGVHQRSITDQLAEFALGHPQYRIVVTTRPIGYVPGRLAEWRHYELVPFGEEDRRPNVPRLLEVLGVNEENVKTVEALIERASKSEMIGTLLKTPLMLTLAVVVAIRCGAIGPTRCELYNQVLGLIREATGERNEIVAIPVSVLDRFIELIALEALIRPTATAENTLNRTSGQLAQALGTPPLAARGTADTVLAYWVGTGLVEHVQHDGIQALSFVHRSFAEFLAARHVAGLTEPARSEALREIGQLPGCDQFVEFAGSLGLADAVLTARGRNYDDPEQIMRALRIARVSEHPPTPETIQPWLEAVFKAAATVSAFTIFEMGADLLALCPRYPGTIAILSRSACGGERPAIRLLGWACRLNCGPSWCTDTEALRALRDAAIILPSDPRESSLRRLPLPRHDTALSLGFGIALTRRFATVRDPDLDQLLLSMFDHGDFSIMSSVMEISHVLELLGRQDLGEQARVRWVGGTTIPELNLDLPQYLEAVRRFEIRTFEALAGMRLEEMPELPDDGRPLIALSGFLSMVKMGDMVISDVWHWRGEQNRLLEWAVLGAIAKISDIELELLTKDAILAARAAHAPSNDEGSVIWGRPLKMDICEPDWTKARQLQLDPAQLQLAIRHGSSWFADVAVNLLDHTLDHDRRENVVETLLTIQDDDAVLAGVRLAIGLPVRRARALLLAHLRGRPVETFRHIFAGLKHLPLEPDQQLLEVIEAVLLSEQGDAAKAAAILLAGLPPTPEILSLAHTAFEAWRNRQPRVKREGIVPASPLEPLLRFLLDHNPPGDAELLA
ncbi:NACHT domain-containing NTPase, partial [Acidocella sp. MX-AZ02]|uniref:NACHT domain-containing protein n=2 Tax=unclassified Acidocella TaxID=2648610 RepID=UPI00028F0198